MRIFLIPLTLLFFGNGCHPQETEEEKKDQDTLLRWCEEINHQNASCPQYERVKLPAEVVAQKKAAWLSWCKQVDQQNVGCPNYPKNAEKAEHLSWCDRIHHQDVKCPDFGKE